MIAITSKIVTNFYAWSVRAGRHVRHSLAPEMIE